MACVPEGDDWIELTDQPLPVDLVAAWSILPTCGGSSIFCGTVRNHSEGRPGVTLLEYEAYDEYVVAKLSEIAKNARLKWPVGRIALLHRIGALSVGEVSVVVAVSTPHRREAIECAEWCIDTIKSSVPIWKREVWEGGSDWASCSHGSDDLLETAEGLKRG